jgi:hypothetical protein
VHGFGVPELLSVIDGVATESSSPTLVQATVAATRSPGGASDIDHVAACGWLYDSPCVRCYPELYPEP